MPALSAELARRLIDWTLGGSSPTQPGARWAGLAVGTPGTDNNAASEMGTLTGYSRLTAL